MCKRTKVLSLATVFVVIVGPIAIGFTGSAATDEDPVEKCIEFLKWGARSTAYEPSKDDAAIALGIIGDKKAVPVLIEHLKHERSGSLRGQIAKALGWMADGRAVPALIETLKKDDYEHCRGMAALALGGIGDKRAVPALEEALNDSYYYNRSYAAKSLKKITGKDYPYEGEKKLGRKLPKLLERGLPEEQQRARQTKRNAAAESKPVEKCIEILKWGETHGVYGPSRRDAVIALGLIGDKKAVPILIGHLKHEPSRHLRCQIAKALGWIGDRRALPVLIDTLKNDTYQYCRGDATLALGDIGDKRAVPALEKALSDENSSVQDNAAEALKKITGKEYPYEGEGKLKDKLRELRQEKVSDCPMTSRRIAILPFENSSELEKLELLEEGLANLVVADLANVEGITAVDRSAMKMIIKEQEIILRMPIDKKTQLKVGRLVGANIVLAGGFSLVESSMKINAHLLDVETTKLLKSAEIEGKVTDIVQLSRELTLKLFRDLDVKIESLKQDKDYVEAWYWLGKTYHLRKEYELALLQWRRTLELFPESKIADATRYEIAALLESDLQMPEEAIKEYQKVVDRYPEFRVDRERFLDDHIRRTKWYHSMIEDMYTKQATKRHSYWGRSLYRMGLCYEKIGHEVEAYKAYWKLVHFVWDYFSDIVESRNEAFDRMHLIYARLIGENREECVEPPIGFITLDIKNPSYFEDFKTEKRFTDIYAWRGEALYVFAAPEGYQIDQLETRIKVTLASTPSYYQVGVTEYPGGLGKTSTRSKWRTFSNLDDRYQDRWKEKVVLPEGTRIVCVVPNTWEQESEIVYWGISAKLSAVDKETPREAQPREKTGSFSVTVDPIDATIYFMGEKSCSGYLTMEKVSPGTHTLKVMEQSYPGCPPSKVREVEILPGQRTSMFVSLRSSPWREPLSVSASGYNPHLFRDNSGKLWLLWQDYHRGESEKSDIYYSTSINGKDWKQPQKVAVSSGANERYPCMRQDMQGTYWLAWLSDRDARAPDSIWISSSPDGAKWSDPTKITVSVDEQAGKGTGYRRYTYGSSLRDFDLLIDAENRLWLVYGTGGAIVSSSDGCNWTGPILINKDWPEGPIGRVIRSPSLIQDKAGTYWIAFSVGRQIYLSSSLDGKTWSSPEKVKAARGQRPSLIQDEEGRFCLAYEISGGISCQLREKDIREWSAPLMLAEYRPDHRAPSRGCSLTKDENGYVIAWRGWPVSDLWVTRARRDAVANSAPKISKPDFWEVVSGIRGTGKMVVDDQYVWIAGTWSSSGLTKYDKIAGNIIFQDKRDFQRKLPSGEINCLASEGKFLWLGSAGAGLIKLNKENNTWSQITKADGLSSNVVTNLALDDAYLWVGTLKGLNRLDKVTGKLVNYGREKKPLSHWVESVAVDGDYVWLSTRKHKHDDKHKPHYLVRYSKTIGECTEIILEKELRCYLGGLDPILPHRHYVWVKGLFSICGYDRKNKKWFQFKVTDLPVATRGLVGDDDVLWVGTSKGLFRYEIATEKIEKFVFRLPEAALPDDFIISLAIDGNWLWVGTIEHVFKVDLSKIKAPEEQ